MPGVPEHPRRCRPPDTGRELRIRHSTDHSQLPYIGGKAALAPKLIAMLPAHRTYVEVFGGAGHVLFRKERSTIEVYNDADARLANLFHVLRDHFDDFAARLRWTLYARSAHAAWRRIGPAGDPIEDALRTFYLLQSSMCGDRSSSWAYSRLRRHANSYERSKTAIEAVSDRFRGVAIDQRDFRDVIRKWDGEETVFFCDPPYYGDAGDWFWTFTEQDHMDLAAMLADLEGKAMVTYYDHPEVRRLYAGWTMIEHHRRRRGAAMWKRSTRAVCELIILNYDPPSID